MASKTKIGFGDIAEISLVVSLLGSEVLDTTMSDAAPRMHSQTSIAWVSRSSASRCTWQGYVGAQTGPAHRWIVETAQHMDGLLHHERGVRALVNGNRFQESLKGYDEAGGNVE